MSTPLTAPYKREQAIRRALSRYARVGRVHQFGTLAAHSPLISKLQKELNAREREERKHA